MKQIGFWIEEKDLATIDEAANKERRSRSAFLIYHALKRAEEIQEKGENNELLQ